MDPAQEGVNCELTVDGLDPLPSLREWLTWLQTNLAQQVPGLAKLGVGAKDEAHLPTLLVLVVRLLPAFFVWTPNVAVAAKELR
jgi:hypothetical protein